MPKGATNEGNKGGSFSYEHRSLLALGQIIGALTPAGAGGLATEATLISVLNAIVASSQDFEILLVRDTGNGNQVIQQITEYITQTVSYKDVNGVAYIPTGPLEYLDPAAVMNLILVELQTLNTVDFATETTLLTVKAVLDAININTGLSATEATLASLNSQILLLTFIGNALEVNVTTSALPTGASTSTLQNATNVLLTSLNANISTEATLLNLDALLTTLVSKDFATEATLLLIKPVLDSIKTDSGVLATPITNLIPALLRVIGAGSATITAGKRRVNFFNAGNTNANVLGVILKAGESISFSADGLRDTLGTFNYDALTSELVITTIG